MPVCTLLSLKTNFFSQRVMITAIIDVCYLPYMEIASNAELSVAGSSFFKYTCLNAVSRTFIVLYSASLHDQNAI
jgi:hypothetical protein